MTYKSFDEVIEKINAKEKPLAVYYHGSKGSKQSKRLLNETSSGAFVMNGPFGQNLDLELGFGGVGHSGMGRIGGYESFKMFSNRKACVIKRAMNFWPNTSLCPPYT